MYNILFLKTLRKIWVNVPHSSILAIERSIPNRIQIIIANHYVDNIIYSKYKLMRPCIGESAFLNQSFVKLLNMTDYLGNKYIVTIPKL